MHGITDKQIIIKSLNDTSLFICKLEVTFIIISIATRPDCLPDEVLELLSECNRIKPLWIELGLQTIHESTAKYIRRGYELPVYDEAVRKLRDLDIDVITHVILGLPGETKEDMLTTVRYVCDSGANGIKLQLLHILKETDLERAYLRQNHIDKNYCEKDYPESITNTFSNQNIKILSEDEYIDILKSCVEIIPNDILIHRLTGDGDKKLLVAPMWSADKKHVWNRIQREVLTPHQSTSL